MSFLNKNNPVWSASTKVVGPVTLGGGGTAFDAITHDGTVTISNQGPVNMFVSANKSGGPAAGNGILMQPGAALTLGLDKDAVVQLTPAGAVYSVVYY